MLRKIPLPLKLLIADFGLLLSLYIVDIFIVDVLARFDRIAYVSQFLLLSSQLKGFLLIFFPFIILAFVANKFLLKRVLLPIQLLIIIAFVFFFGSYTPELIARIFYTFSLQFKWFLFIFLPFMLFALVFTGILAFRKSATIVLLILLGAIFTSDIVIALTSYATGRLILPSLVESMVTQQLIIKKSLKTLFPIVLELPVRLEKVLIFSILFGIIFSFFTLPRFERVMYRFKVIVEDILRYGFIPTLPLYVFGFLLKIQHEGIFTELFRHYSNAFILIFSVQAFYLFFFYLAATGFSLKRCFRAIKNAFPSYLTAFSTMSSMIALPISIDAAEKNTGNPALAEMSMPIMANLHFLGVATNMPILALATMMLFWGVIPDFTQYFIFVLYLCYTMIAISGVPGSGIFLLAPLLILQFGFSPEMISVVTALYLLIESFGAAANAFGDGALIIIVNKIIKRLGF